MTFTFEPPGSGIGQTVELDEQAVELDARRYRGNPRILGAGAVAGAILTNFFGVVVSVLGILLQGASAADVSL
jgi:hypothetical protein